MGLIWQLRCALFGDCPWTDPAVIIAHTEREMQALAECAAAIERTLEESRRISASASFRNTASRREVPLVLDLGAAEDGR